MRNLGRVLIAVYWTLAAVRMAPAQTAEPVSRADAGAEGGGSAGRQITLRREAVTLDALLSDLADTSEQRLTCAENVRWDQVSLSVHNRPVAQVRTELAKLLNYTWVTERQRPAALRQEVRAAAFEASRRRAWYGAAADGLLRYAALARRPPEYYRQLERARKTDPAADPTVPRIINLDFLKTPSKHATLRLLLALTPEQFLEAVSADTDGYYLPWRQMNGLQRELAQGIAGSIAARDGRDSSFRPEPEAPRWLQQTGLVLNAHSLPLQVETPEPAYYEVWIAGVDEFGGFGITPLPRLKDGSLRNFGDSPFPPLREGEQPRGTPYAVEPNIQSNLRGKPAAGEGSLDYRDLERAPFPGGNLRITYPARWPDVLVQLMDRLPYALYSDFFPSPPVSTGPGVYPNPATRSSGTSPRPSEPMSVAAALDLVCAQHGRIWWREGDAIYIRSRTWYLDRLSQVPPPVLARLGEQLRTGGKLDREGFRLLAGLTARQLAGFRTLILEARGRDSRDTRYSGLETRLFGLLRVYALLTLEQEQRVLGDGLAFQQMTPTQQQAYWDALALCKASAEWLRDPPPFRFEQTTVPGVSDRQPALGELTFSFLANAGRPASRQATLYIPFAALRPEPATSQRRP